MLHAHTDTVALGDLGNWDSHPSIRWRGTGAFTDAEPATTGLAGGDAGGLQTLLRDTSWQSRGKLLLVAAGGEERGGVGAQLLIERGITADAAVVGECTDLKPVIAHKALFASRSSPRGSRPCGEPEQGVNAIDAMAPLIMRLKRLSRG